MLRIKSLDFQNKVVFREKNLLHFQEKKLKYVENKITKFQE